MDEQDVLQRLLGVEKMAAELVLEAQAAADAKVADSDHAARTEYDDAYARRLSELEAEWKNKTESIDSEYRLALDAYQTELEAKPVHEREFSQLAAKLLSGER